jgi:hypothetical protein
MAPQCNEIKIYQEYLCHFNKLWENKYFSISANNICVCLISNAGVAVSKKCNGERHFVTMQEDNISKYVDNSEIHRNKFED